LAVSIVETFICNVNSSHNVVIEQIWS